MRNMYKYDLHTVRHVVFELTRIPQSSSCSSNEVSPRPNARRRSVPATKRQATKCTRDEMAGDELYPRRNGWRRSVYPRNGGDETAATKRLRRNGSDETSRSVAGMLVEYCTLYENNELMSTRGWHLAYFTHGQVTYLQSKRLLTAPCCLWVACIGWVLVPPLWPQLNSPACTEIHNIIVCGLWTFQAACHGSQPPHIKERIQ